MSSETTRIFVSLPDNFLEEFDAAIKEAGYASRSGAIREGMRILLQKIRKRR